MRDGFFHTEDIEGTESTEEFIFNSSLCSLLLCTLDFIHKIRYNVLDFELLSRMGRCLTMAVGIVIGNINKFTFVNSIIAMNNKAKELHCESISLFFVLHSIESYDSLVKKDNDWLFELDKYGISSDSYFHRIIDFNSNDEDAIFSKLIDTFKMVIRYGSTEKLILDISNGKIFDKAILSIFSYVLNLKSVFNIDIQILKAQNSNLEAYLSPSELMPAYRQLPRNDALDEIGLLSLTEVNRYRNIIEELTLNIRKIDDSADLDFIQNNLLLSIEQKLLTDANNTSYEILKKSSNSKVLYRMATSSIFTSFEEVVHRILISTDKLYTEKNQLMLGQKLARLYTVIVNTNSPEIDIEFLDELNRFLRYMRNSTTHKGKYLLASETYKAKLSIILTLSAIDYYANIVFPELKKPAVNCYSKDIDTNEQPRIIYYGLDGDKTGKALELLLFKNSSIEDVKKFSEKVARARRKVNEKIKELEGKRIFSEGDDILFTGTFSFSQLEEIKKIYNDESGMTCSIAYSDNLRDLLLSMKIAKSTGNTIHSVTSA